MTANNTPSHSQTRIHHHHTTCAPPSPPPSLPPILNRCAMPRWVPRNWLAPRARAPNSTATTHSRSQKKAHFSACPTVPQSHSCSWPGPVDRACPRSHGCGRTLSEAPPSLRSARPLCAGIQSDARAHTFILVTTTRMNSDQHLVVVLSHHHHHHSPLAQNQTASSAHWCAGVRGEALLAVVVGAVAPRGRRLCGW